MEKLNKRHAPLATLEKMEGVAAFHFQALLKPTEKP